jgi:DNA-binding NtrC family response regulator
MPHTVLVVDDEKNIRRTLRMVLEGEGYAVEESESGEEALARAGEADVILLDVKLPGMSGLEALPRLRPDEVPVIMISGHGTLEDAVQATKAGAYDFLQKPLDRDRVVVTVRNALERRSLKREVGQSRARHEMIGQSAPMIALFTQIAKVAPTKGRVLITGESGTGKELIARAIHLSSSVAKASFVKVNCAAIPPELIESELFGHEKGSFTGATARKRGLFEVADSGTIFLDEIGDMSLSAQAKVLRVLQAGELTRVGGESVIKVDVRVIAATNKELSDEVKAGRFREDLYFRLNVVPLRAPALRERTEDIPLLATAFVEQTCLENGFRHKQIDPDVMERLKAYPWPGNVRELRNLMERLVILSDEVITVSDLPDPYQGGGAATAAAALGVASASGGVDGKRFGNITLREFREEMEKEFILSKLAEHGWNISRTAEALGIERTNLHKKMRAHGITRGE